LGHGVPLVALLTGTALLSACAAGEGARMLRGQAGRVAWEIVDIEQALEDQGFLMRWTFTIVLRNTSDVGIAFQQVETATQAVGTVDSIWGGMGTQPFALRLEPGGELRIRPSQVWGCPLCPQADLRRIFADGIILYYTLLGRDDTGGEVRFPSPSASTAAWERAGSGSLSADSQRSPAGER
jgi:hypothetical protein